VLARKLAQRLTPLLGEAVVVENKAGAAGTIGCVEVARAKPDGYTLLMGTTGTHAINPSTMVNPRYDAVRDFAPIALLGTQPFSIAVYPGLPAQTLRELVALAKANPGKYAYASAGAGGIAHLTAELFKLQAGDLDITHVPYKGGGPAMQDVLAGHVQIFSDSFSTTYPQHKVGKLRVLAMTGEKRSASAPDIPTAIEAGVPGLVSSTAGILLAPANTPPAVIDTLYRAVAKALADEGFLKDLEALSIDPVTDAGPEKTAQFIRSEIARWAPIIKATGTRME
jgi:tripartite-type tricarboxylate transporter receptor subunit TctC